MKGHEYKGTVARYIASAFGDRGLEIFDEVSVGTSILGKPRRVDLLVLGPRRERVLALECKYQDSAGTVDEKIPYALQDLSAMRIPGAIVYAGTGFSEGVLYLLKASPLAAYCMPDASMRPLPRPRGDAMDTGTWQLDHVLAQTFGWWDVIIGPKLPL